MFNTQHRYCPAPTARNPYIDCQKPARADIFRPEDLRHLSDVFHAAIGYDDVTERSIRGNLEALSVRNASRDDLCWAMAGMLAGACVYAGAGTPLSHSNYYHDNPTEVAWAEQVEGRVSVDGTVYGHVVHRSGVHAQVYLDMTCVDAVESVLRDSRDDRIGTPVDAPVRVVAANPAPGGPDAANPWTAPGDEVYVDALALPVWAYAANIAARLIADRDRSTLSAGRPSRDHVVAAEDATRERDQAALDAVVDNAAAWIVDKVASLG